MKSIFQTLTLLIVFAVLWTPLTGQPSGGIHGWIKLPDEVQKKVRKGKNYNRDGSMMMRSNDPLAQINRNVIISFHPLSEVPLPDSIESVYITQKEQTFIPFVVPFRKGAQIYILNEDEFFHNVYSLTPGARFNVGRRPPGSPYSITIKKLGPIKLFCDIHPHMAAILLSLDTPFFTRIKGDGTYEVKGLPIGKYRVEVFHPIASKVLGEITVLQNQSVTLNFDLTQNQP